MPDTDWPELTDERIYADLKAYQDAGMLDYVLPTDPIGEQWIVGWRGQILKFVTKDSIAGFLTGIQVAALFAADLRGPADLREMFRDRQPVHGAAVHADPVAAELAAIRERSERPLAHPGALPISNDDVRGLMGAAGDVPALLGAVEAVLKLADDWHAKGAETWAQVMLQDCDGASAGLKAVGATIRQNAAREFREVISRELAKGRHR